jgi:hypothetical protein
MLCFLHFVVACVFHSLVCGLGVPSDLMLPGVHVVVSACVLVVV